MAIVFVILIILFVLGYFGFFKSMKNFIFQLLEWHRKEVEAKNKAMLKAKELDLRIEEARCKATELEIQHYEQRRLQPPPD